MKQSDLGWDLTTCKGIFWGEIKTHRNAAADAEAIDAGVRQFEPENS